MAGIAEVGNILNWISAAATKAASAVGKYTQSICGIINQTADMRARFTAARFIILYLWKANRLFDHFN